jgi:hypothetical protein
MKFRIDITPDLLGLMRAEIAAGERAVTAAMRGAGSGLKQAWRGQVTGAGLGSRLANTIRSQAYPSTGTSLNAAALVWSKAPLIIGAHDTEVRLLAGDPDAGRRKGARRPARHPAHLGAADRPAAALRLPPDRAEPARGRGAALRL